MSCPDLDYVCISAEHFCDGVPDCPNGADEKPETCGMFQEIIFIVLYNFVGMLHLYGKTSQHNS